MQEEAEGGNGDVRNASLSGGTPPRRMTRIPPAAKAIPERKDRPQKKRKREDRKNEGKMKGDREGNGERGREREKRNSKGRCKREQKKENAQTQRQ